jgi:hypothetical protein
MDGVDVGAGHLALRLAPKDRVRDTLPRKSNEEVLLTEQRREILLTEFGQVLHGLSWNLRLLTSTLSLSCPLWLLRRGGNCCVGR